jgi:hypothetical protein
MWLTLQGLSQAGHDVTLVAPAATSAQEASAARRELATICTPRLVPAAARAWPAALAAAITSGRALTVVRHDRPEVAAEVARVVQDRRPDVVHAEQLQALAACGAARRAGVPIVLRMQNVESDLWRLVARARPGAGLLALEAARLRRDERRAVASVACTVALTPRDAGRLRHAMDDDVRARVHAVPPGVPPGWPPGLAVEGEPAVAVAGSGGWWPNRDGLRWFLDEVWPRVTTAWPGARLHIYGGHDRRSRPGVVGHAAPDDSAAAFPQGSICAVPLRVASGIRMRILEAWSRGLPVVATPEAAAGLEWTGEPPLLTCHDAAAFADAIVRLARDPDGRTRLAALGRSALEARYDPASAIGALLDVYRAATGPVSGGLGQSQKQESRSKKG